MQPRSRPPLVTISAGYISYAHTVLGFSAFFGALILGLCLHYHKIVKNHVAGWPDEWWPSVSATIGDWPQERSILQIFIALMSGPRISLVLLSALLVSLSNPQSFRSKALALTGILRTLSCGGWVYCTSTDLPLIHDVAMILYLVLTPVWMFISWGSLAPQPEKEARATAHDSPAAKLSERARKTRRNTAAAFFASIPFMCLFYYRHRVLEIPGAYTTYSFFEWNLIIQVSKEGDQQKPTSSHRLSVPLYRTSSSTCGQCTTSAGWRYISSKPQNRHPEQHWEVAGGLGGLQ